MTAPQPPEPAGPPGRRGWREVCRFLALFQDLLAPKVLLPLAGVLAVAVIGLLGGWRQVSNAEPATPEVAPGTTLAADPLRLTVKKAFWTRQLAGLLRPEAGIRYLAVTVGTVNTSPLPVAPETYLRALRLDVEGLLVHGRRARPSEQVRPEAFRGADALPAGALQPGLEQTVVLVWRQAEEAPPPVELAITVKRQTYRTSALDGSRRWLDAAPVGRLRLPVRELVGGRP